MFSFYPSANDPIMAWKSYIAGRTNLENINSSLKMQYNAQREMANTQFQQNEAINNTMANNTDALEKQTGMLQKVSFDQIQAIEQNTIEVCGSIDKGFDLLAESIEELGSIIDFRLSTIMENQIISNLLSANIALLLKIPDFQKERQYHIEQGLKHFKNATFDSDLYNDALENLLKAEKLEKTDYVVLYYLGMIFLYSPNNNDLILAREYFQKALKYSLVETNENALVLANILTGDINKKLDENIVTIDAIKNISAKICLQIGITYYVQNMLDDALNFYSKSLELNPKLHEAAINKVRTLILLNKQDEAGLLIYKLLDENYTWPEPNCFTVTKLLPIFSTDIIISSAPIYKLTLNKTYKILEEGIIWRINHMKEHLIQNSKYENDLKKYENDVSKYCTLFDLQNDHIRRGSLYEDINDECSRDEEIKKIKENEQQVELIKQQVELIKQQGFKKIEELKIAFNKAIVEKQKQDKKFLKINRDYSECIKSFEHIYYDGFNYQIGNHVKVQIMDAEFNLSFARERFDKNNRCFDIEKGLIKYETLITELIKDFSERISRYPSY